MILVVGATGRVGTCVIPMLLAKGYAVRAMTRSPEKAGGLKQLGVEVFQGDVRDPTSLAQACRGVEQVLDAAHGFTPGQPGNDIHSVDDLGNRNLIHVAKAAGVKHFVFISVLGATPTSMMEFVRTKYLTEQRLIDSGMSYTILRAAAFMEFWAANVGEPILKAGKTTIFGSGKNPINFVCVEDVARFCVIALEDRRALDQVINVGGPENLTFNQVAELFEKVGGRAAKKSHVPLPVMRVMRVLTRSINPMLSLQVTGGILMDTEDQTCCMEDSTLRQYPVKLVRLESVARKMAESVKA
jgi:uncharacterized protein YbjT (DUF2867 family)